MKKKLNVKKKLRPRSKKYPIISGYLSKVFSTKEFIKIIDKLALKIKDFDKKNHFDAIAFTGTSGSAVAYPLSYKLKIPLICIRKGRNSHYGEKYEGVCNIKKYIIVDDLVNTGNTIKKIQREIKYQSPEAKLIAVFLYADGRSTCYYDTYLNISENILTIKV
jgi:adenine/guanine phosphoribosyltransferase-like PRPP-binding protein